MVDHFKMWLEIEPQKEESEEMEEPISCFGCKYFDSEIDRDWETGIEEYTAFCFAKDEEGEDLYYDSINDNFPIWECPYREEVENES